MAGLFAVLFLIAIITFIFSLFKPKLIFWTKAHSRKHSFIYLAVALVFFILIGVLAPPTT